MSTSPSVENQTNVELPAPVLEAVHLRKEFPVRGKMFGPSLAVHAVEDATVTLRPGRATALVGESGSGKTTVARMLARIYNPTSGTIKFRGSRSRSPRAPRRCGPIAATCS
ncbi:hypothetical protein KDH_65330 [Dictyobacter sp. S3.2.2.5]|uniref:ABC transporter domain-containing protein n=1 Tax=Dictyobacter halimunensis TaxID=3026934 RepID=A0ABQ6FZL0_9CHLR|nr:hypothetical protein KDH_65330 [Dictyobacter sp. S3.2.2.5]